MRKKTLSKSELKELNDILRISLGIEPFSKKDSVVIVESEITYYTVNGQVDYAVKDDKVIPTLKNLLRNNFLKKITVDMGAVKYVVSGADVMRPGIVSVEDGIEKDSIVAIIDQNNKKPLSVGLALYNSQGITSATGGRCIKNLHYIGDSIWKIE